MRVSSRQTEMAGCNCLMQLASTALVARQKGATTFVSVIFMLAKSVGRLSDIQDLLLGRLSHTMSFEVSLSPTKANASTLHLSCCNDKANDTEDTSSQRHVV